MSQDTTRTEKCIDRDDAGAGADSLNYCEHCDREYPPEDARSILIRGPGDVLWGCPRCGRTTQGAAPGESIQPPVIEDLDVTVDEQGYTTAAIVFPNDARLQYRETEDGHVREEVLSFIGEELDSFSIGLQAEVNTYRAYAKAVKRYTELTEAGLRREMPHVAAAVLDDHER